MSISINSANIIFQENHVLFIKDGQACFNLTVQRVRKYIVQWLTIDIDLDGSWKRLVDGLVLGLTSELRTQIATAQLYTNFISAGSCAILFFKRAYFTYDEKTGIKKWWVEPDSDSTNMICFDNTFFFQNLCMDFNKIIYKILWIANT